MLVALEAFNSIPGMLTTGHHHQYMRNDYINLVTTCEDRIESFLSTESQSWRFEHGEWKGNWSQVSCMPHSPAQHRLKTGEKFLFVH